MAISFDPIQKWIKILSPTIEADALAMYSQAMDWADDQANMVHEPPMSAVGKAPLGGGVYTDSIFILENGWKIKPWNGNYQLNIYGTLISGDEFPRTEPPDSGNVETVFTVTSQGTITGVIWTEEEKADQIITTKKIQKLVF